MKYTPFQEKIAYLFQQLKISQEEFIKLFWNGESKTLISRRKTVTSWLDTNKQIKQPKGFYFHDYPIAKWSDRGKPFFTKEAFLYDSIEAFKQHVEKYLIFKTLQPNEVFNHKYIYYFDLDLKKITFFEIAIQNKIVTGYTIQLISHELTVEPYFGSITFTGEQYHISVKNSFEILTFYFTQNRGYSKDSSLYGIRLGLSYSKGLPISAKCILTTKQLLQEEENHLYLDINESAYLMIDELSNNIYTQPKQNHIQSFVNKINTLSKYTQKSQSLLNHQMQKDIYLNIFHKTFRSFNEISKKVLNGGNYFISSRRNATQIFLKNSALDTMSQCTIVYPLFKNDSTLFDEHNSEAKASLALNIHLAQSGLKIYRIIVVDANYTPSFYFKSVIESLIENGIEISIAIKEEIEHLVSSYDFVFNTNHDVAIYRNVKNPLCYFKVTKNKMKIQELLDDCKIIREKSYNFTDFLTQPYQQYKESLEPLLGTWHLYFYGTHPKFWHNIFKINQNREVEKWFENKLISKGMIELCCPNQYYIQITNHESVDLSLMILNKNDIHKPLFTVSIIDNEWAKHSKKMTSIGLFSRVELTDEEVIQTLGENPLETCLKETPELEDRVAKLCRQMELTKFK